MTPIGLLLPRPRKFCNMVNARRYRPSRTHRAEVRKVLAAYDLGELKGYRPPAIGSSRSRNLVLDIGDGRKVLKRYKSSMSFEGITYEHSVLKHLAANSFPCPRLIPNRKGKTCLEVEGRHYVLFDFIPGFSYTDYFVPAGRAKLFLAEAGKMLARYHQIVDGFAPAGRKLDGFMPDGQERWQDQDWYLTRLTRYEALFRAKHEKSDLDQSFLDNLDRLKHSYVGLNQGLEGNFSQLPKVVNHGDYGPYNLLFDEKGLVAVLDFECVHLNLRATEVGTALRRFASLDVGLDYGKALVFLEAYHSSYPLTVSEIEWMPALFRLALLEGLVYHLRDYFDLGNPLKIHHATESIAWIDWMEQNGDELVEVLLACIDNRHGGQRG